MQRLGAVVVLTVQGAQSPVGIVDVELLDGSFDAEFFVATVPEELTLFFRTSSLEGDSHPALRIDDPDRCAALEADFAGAP